MIEFTPWQKYQNDLQDPEFQYDAAQENAVKELQRLYDELTHPEQKLTWRIKLQSTFGKGMRKPSIQGLYFLGWSRARENLLGRYFLRVFTF